MDQVGPCTKLSGSCCDILSDYIEALVGRPDQSISLEVGFNVANIQGGVENSLYASGYAGTALRAVVEVGYSFDGLRSLASKIGIFADLESFLREKVNTTSIALS